LATDADLASAIALALTGVRLEPPAGAPSRLSVASLPDDLAAAGYDATRLAELRQAAQEEQRPWPFAVPLDELRELGFARFDAALAEARRGLGLDGLKRRLQVRRPLDRDEQRLSADRPPHWG